MHIALPLQGLYAFVAWC